jgi:PIN domain nuclease of toxin-antitoxin system
MTLLLDTHALIWAIGDPAKLSSKVARAITSSENEVVVSSVSLFEIALKAEKGKLGIPLNRDYMDTQMKLIGVSRILDLTPTHVYAFLTVPRIHKDPFDRLLAAQCIAENYCLVSRDAHLKRYPIRILW